MRTVVQPEELQELCLQARCCGERVGFVPTMGFLHRGHLSLMEHARPQCDLLVVSIFVNPLQFGPGEDLDRYPRDPAGDAEKCASVGVDVLFTPSALYSNGHSTQVAVSGLTDGLCGGSRPGHFDGVTTVVARLFGLAQPHLAVFGEKDFQQLAVLRRMARDLAMPIDVQGAPLIRDHDGLALSSRNAYLSPSNRKRALSLSAALRAVVDHTSENATTRLTDARTLLEVDHLDYFSIVQPDTLEDLALIDGPARVLVAAKVGPTRLIDNMAL